MNVTPHQVQSRRRWSQVLFAVSIVLLSLIASGPAARRLEPEVSGDSLARQAGRRLTEWRSGDPSLPLISTPDQLYIVIDTHTNRLYLRTLDSLLLSLFCSTGTGAELTDSLSGRSWRFDTPRGIFAITAMATDPVWRKPDWAFIEEGEPVPTDATERLDTESLGDYSLAFGDGYYIHGTLYERLIGVAVTHGCIRLASEDLAGLYAQVEIGTPVVIF
jgi:lipoprotein-anchoring transpeptidase ErfK/SrfK